MSVGMSLWKISFTESSRMYGMLKAMSSLQKWYSEKRVNASSR